MGQGDIKTKRGKIWRGSHGVRRPKSRNADSGQTESSKK